MSIVDRSVKRLSKGLNLTQMTHGTLHILNEAEGATELQYNSNLSGEALDKARRLSLPESYYPQVYEGRPVFLDDYVTEGTKQFSKLLSELNVVALCEQQHPACQRVLVCHTIR